MSDEEEHDEGMITKEIEEPSEIEAARKRQTEEEEEREKERERAVLEQKQREKDIAHEVRGTPLLSSVMQSVLFSAPLQLPS